MFCLHRAGYAAGTASGGGHHQALCMFVAFTLAKHTMQSASVLASLQRYISTRPLFIDARELALGQGAAQVTDASSAITALRSLAALYKAIIQAVKDEAMIMEQVFLDPAAALVMFVTRLFEQRVQVTGCDTGQPSAARECFPMHLVGSVMPYQQYHILIQFLLYCCFIQSDFVVCLLPSRQLDRLGHAISGGSSLQGETNPCKCTVREIKHTARPRQS